MEHAKHFSAPMEMCMDDHLTQITGRIQQQQLYQCTCPQATTSGSETWRLVSLEKSSPPTQWKDFCEQTPIEKVRHSVTLFRFL